jgi:hypothetical protein
MPGADAQTRRHRGDGQCQRSQGRKCARSDRSCERGAALCYLPPYSPDLNPIELSYSAFKAFLRKCAEEAFAAASDSSCGGCPPKPAPTSSLMQGVLQGRNLL